MNYNLYIYHKNNTAEGEFSKWEFKSEIETNSPEIFIKLIYSKNYPAVDYNKIQVKCFEASITIHKIKFNKMYVAFNGGNDEIVLAEKLKKKGE